MKGSEWSKYEGSRLLSLNFKRGVIRFVLASLMMSLLLTSSGISSLQFVIRASIPDESSRGRNLNQEFSPTRSYWKRVFVGRRDPIGLKNEGSRHLSVNFKKWVIRFVISLLYDVFTFNGFRYFLSAFCADELLFLFFLSWERDFWGQSWGGRLSNSSVRIKIVLKPRSFCEDQDSFETKIILRGSR